MIVNVVTTSTGDILITASPSRDEHLRWPLVTLIRRLWCPQKRAGWKVALKRQGVHLLSTASLGARID